MISLLTFSDGFNRRLREITGVLMILGSLFTVLSLVTYQKWDSSFFVFSSNPVRNYGGPAGAFLSDLLLSSLGFSSYLVPFFFILSGIRRILGRDRRPEPFLGAVCFIAAAAILLQILPGIAFAGISDPGGALGFYFVSLFRSYISDAGTIIADVALMLIALILLSPVSLFRLPARPPVSVRKEKEPEVSVLPQKTDIVITALNNHKENGKNTKGSEHIQDSGSARGGYVLPPIDLLRDAQGAQGPIREELNGAAAGLERKLADFGVSGKIVQAHPGPVVTMFEFEPAPGVKINRIVSLSDDLALSMKAQSIRVYPIPGKAAMGIEVPNRLRAPVALKDIISSEGFRKSTSLLTFALGKDIFGTPIVTDLARMPHLLVAGATGSGKSVSVNAMIISLLYKASPDEVKMIMVDPKLLELSVYGDIPHLMSPVITNPKDASHALKKVVSEMERRYRLLAEKGARSIDSYNRNAAPGEKLPYIVVFIDELADLMFTAPTDVEGAIARLAQMARASGIHLILATQRPSVDVITGLIKANFPARISFQVTTRIDSRTILDTQGAEHLLGMGDMLFMVPGAKLMRIHGAYVGDAEVEAVTKFVKAQGKPDYTSFESITVVEEKDGTIETAEGERDALYEKVIEFCESVREVSISSIQRRFKVGYNKAARIMEMLEEDGLVGPQRGAGKPREFLGRKQDL